MAQLTWQARGWLAIVAVVAVALWPVFLLIALMVVVLGWLIHPKSLRDFVRWFITIPWRITQGWLREFENEYIIVTSKAISHSVTIRWITLFAHREIRRSWWQNRGPSSRCIQRAAISSISLKQIVDYEHPLLIIEHRDGIEAIGFDLSDDEKKQMYHFLVAWQHDGKLVELVFPNDDSLEYRL